MVSNILIVLGLMLAASAPAFGYVGPGSGAGAIGVIVGLVGSIFLALFAVVYYPLKRRIKKWRGEDEVEVDDEVKASDTEDESVT